MNVITRRQFLKRLAWSTTALGAGMAGYSTLVEPRRVEINHLPIAIKGLPPAFAGLTIAQLTDLHRSRFVGAGYLNHCIDLANASRPDLMVFTGDYLTHGRAHSRRGQLVYGGRDAGAALALDCARCLGRARARFGVFASLGNHDHWFDGDFVAQVIRDRGIPVLRNANTEVRVNGESLPIVGLGDLWTEGVNLSRAFAGVTAPFALVLMHNPDTFPDWSRPGAHLILAGHTHGGQVNLPGIGPPLVPSEYGAKYAQGLFRRGDTQMYVNRGLGVLFPPVRFNCRPEIAVFHLQSA